MKAELITCECIAQIIINKNRTGWNGSGNQQNSALIQFVSEIKANLVWLPELL